MKAFLRFDWEICSTIEKGVAPDIQIALKLADENRMNLDLVKLELIERDVIIAANEHQAQNPAHR